VDARTGPQAEVRDERGWVVEPEWWTNEQRAQWQAAITAQFSEGEQLPTLQAVRDEVANRMTWVEDWDHHRALNTWMLRQMDGLIGDSRTGNG